MIRKLAEEEKLLGQGKDLEEVCRHLEITESTWNRWRNQYGGMKADEAKRLKELEQSTAPEPLAVSVEEAGRLLGISRDLAYDLVARGQLPAVRLGRRIVVPRRLLDELVAPSGR